MKPSVSPRKYKNSRQKSGSDMFLNALLKRRRGAVSRRTVVRKYGKTLIIILVLTVICFSVFYAYGYVEKKELLNIKEVEVVGASNYVNKNDVSMLAESNLIGKKYFSVDLVKTADLLKSNFLGAKNISVQRASVGKIQIAVEERVPLAVLLSESDNKSYLIDGDGYILGEVDSNLTNLPVVRYKKSVMVGSFVEKDMVPITIEILALSEKDDLKVSSISYYPKYTVIYVLHGVEVSIGNTKNKENSMRVVSSLLKKSNPDGKKVSRIDLRFDKVIVSYE